MSDSAAVRYAQSPDAATTSVGDRVVVYHRTSRAAIVLNPTGTHLWARLTARQSAADLARALAAAYPTLSAERAARDVDAFLSQLTAHALLAIHP